MSHNQFPTYHGNPIMGAQQIQTTTASASSLPTGTMATHHTTYVPPQSGNSPVLQQQSKDHSMTGHYHQPQMVHVQQQQQHELTAGLSSMAIYNQQQGQFVGIVPQQQQTAQAQQSAAINKSRKLQVDDALSYLEKVRQQFTTEPKVYNDFLEVMKEFKSHTIDTNGVILRVSRLFRSYPDLIDGFNTFLPHGYEVRVHGSIVCIFEPNGKSSMINNTNGELVAGPLVDATTTSLPQSSASVARQIPIQQKQNQQTMHPLDVTTAYSTSSTIVPIIQPEQKISMNRGGEVRGELSSGLLSAAAGTFLHQPPMKDRGQINVHQNYTAEIGIEKNSHQSTKMMASPPITQQQPIHFNEALGYLNRIKERFADRPDVYSEFLNILRNYQQRERGKKLTEADVYQAVARLFHNELDLMRDFKSFLPDAKLEFADRQNEQLINVGRNDERESADSLRTSSSSKLSTLTAISQKRQIGKEYVSVNAKKSKGQVNKVSYDVGISDILEEIPLKDFAIFEKIHHALQNETIFKNFIRLLMLYNKSLVSRSELLDLVTPFLAGNPELLKQFKDLLGGQSAIAAQSRKQLRLDERLPNEIAAHIDYNTCKQHGVSYRSLPDEIERPRCSGRTALCNEVLNDDYVSYPTWSSEDSSALSSKKCNGQTHNQENRKPTFKFPHRSQFEDLMYRTEDERFEVDILIEVNSAAIIALEYARRKIESMTHEEAKKFMAESDLGCSPVVLRRAVKKLYGEHASKMTMGLKENPVVAIPIILKRLREKDVEWRGLRKEFNAIWRDQVEKNYLKSLDHQALTFKANDVKSIRSKSFIQQLETIYKERIQKAEEGGEEEHGPQLVLEYPSDRQVFNDANELLLHFIKRQANITKKEKGRIKELLHLIIPKLFMIEMPSDTENVNKEELSEKSEGEVESMKIVEKPVEESAIASRPRRVRKEDSKNSGKGQNSSSKNTPTSSSTAAAVKQSNDSLMLAYVLFFGTNSWLLFIRLHAILCDRLAAIKKRTEELISEYNVELQLRERQEQIYEEQGDSEEAQLMSAVDVHLGLREFKKPLQNPEDYYQIMLQEMKNLLDGQIEASTFEDTLRAMFDTKAYVLFTMDKLVNTLVRQLQNFVGDETSTSCIELFKKYFEQRSNGCEGGDAAARSDQEYIAAAEKLLLKQNCFQMYFINRFRPVVTVELIDTDEPDSESDDEEESKNVIAISDWDDYLKKLNTNLPEHVGHLPFMRRNLRFRRISAKFFKKAIKDHQKSPERNLEEIVEKMPHFYTSIGFGRLINSEEPNPVSLLKKSVMDEWNDDIWGEVINDVLVRKGAPPVDKKAFRKASIARQKTYNNWLDKIHKDDNELSARWMTTGCTSRPCQHPKFKYLRYNIYSSKIQSE